MTAMRSIVSIVTLAARANANATLDALNMDFGPGTYGLGLSPDASWPPTHFGCSHATATEAQHQVWAGLLDGTLPEGVAWGVGAVISEEDAIGAFADANVVLDCITHTNPEFDFNAHVAAIRGQLGLQIAIPPD